MTMTTAPLDASSHPYWTACGYPGVAEVSQALAPPKAVIAVLDDDPATLRGITRLLSIRGFDVKPFSSPCTFLEDVESLCPACLISDLWMPELTGLDVQREISKRGLSCPVVFLTGAGDIRLSVQAMRGGAVDFLTKPFEQDDLLCAIEHALARSAASREKAARLAGIRQRSASLTEREREVFALVVSGLLNKQIAGNLGIAEKTVKVHRARVMRKMNARSLAQLVRTSETLTNHQISN